MYSVSIMDAPLGSIIAEPIFVDNTLLINKGVSLSNNLRHALLKFKVKSISVEGTFTQDIDESKLQFGSFDNLTYIAIRSLEFDKIMVCARTMVDALRNGNNLTNLLSIYDMNTMQHSINVASLSLSVGVTMGLSIHDLENLAVGALLHDVGKMRIPTEVLNKTDKLTDEEYKLIMTHPYEGYKLIKELMPQAGEVIKQIVYQHHEDFDGTGYPRQLSDFHIYKLARIVHICDVFDALSSKRAYKVAFPKQLIWDIMDGYCNSKFDPFIYRKFRRVIPLYFLGEEIIIGDSVGIVIKTYEDNPEYPDVYFNGAIINYGNLVDMNKDKIERIKGSDGILHLEKIL